MQESWREHRRARRLAGLQGQCSGRPPDQRHSPCSPCALSSGRLHMVWGSGNRTIWAPHKSCMTLDKSLYLSNLHFPKCKVGLLRVAI